MLSPFPFGAEGRKDGMSYLGGNQRRVMCVCACVDDVKVSASAWFILSLENWHSCI